MEFTFFESLRDLIVILYFRTQTLFLINSFDLKFLERRDDCIRFVFELAIQEKLLVIYVGEKNKQEMRVFVEGVLLNSHIDFVSEDKLDDFVSDIGEPDVGVSGLDGLDPETAERLVEGLRVVAHERHDAVVLVHGKLAVSDALIVTENQLCEWVLDDFE